MKTYFGNYIDKKHRDARNQLGILKEIFKRKGIKVADYRNSEDGNDPYIYVYSTSPDTSFNGVRIYKIGSKLAFRLQKEEKTYPYGTAYELDIQKLFVDLLSDNIKEEKAGNLVIETIIKEMKRFFHNSAKIEAEFIKNGNDPDAGANMRLIHSTQTDNSSPNNNN